MNKIIIQNNTDLSDEKALEYITWVVGKGRVSNFGKQYCYHTAFTDRISVSAFLNKKSDRFVIYGEFNGGRNESNSSI